VCAGERASGSLSGTGSSATGQSLTVGGGVHKGCLTGPAGTNFDLYLDRRYGSFWFNVAAGTSAGSSEVVTYNGASGTYRWRVRSAAGSGAFELQFTRP
jgi:streptogrisin C